MDDLPIPAEPVAQAAEDVRASFVREVEKFVKLFAQLPERERLFRLLEVWGQAPPSGREQLDRLLNQLTNKPYSPPEAETWRTTPWITEAFNAEMEQRQAARLEAEKDKLRDHLFEMLSGGESADYISRYFRAEGNATRAAAVAALLTDWPAQGSAWQEQRRTEARLRQEQAEKDAAQHEHPAYIARLEEEKALHRADVFELLEQGNTPAAVRRIYEADGKTLTRWKGLAAIALIDEWQATQGEPAAAVPALA